MSKQPVSRLQDDDMQAVQPALLRAARRAREIARQTGTAVVVMRDGKLVKERPVAEAGVNGAVSELSEDVPHRRRT